VLFRSIKETGDFRFVPKLIEKLSAEAEEYRKNEPEPTSDYTNEPSAEDLRRGFEPDDYYTWD
jgi:hypothetical protein